MSILLETIEWVNNFLSLIKYHLPSFLAALGLYCKFIEVIDN